MLCSPSSVMITFAPMSRGFIGLAKRMGIV
jgi:hypothetical protein